MAKKGMLEREKKRKRLVSKHQKMREKLLLARKAVDSLELVFEINGRLQKLPPNSALNRLRNRCWKTGRPRGYYRFFGLCRNALREMAHDCFLPGVTKASW